MHLIKHKRWGGFSILETLSTLTVVIVIAVVAVPAAMNLTEGAKSSKFDTEVSSLNNAVKSFVSSGGLIEETTTPLEVLDLLKASVSQEDAVGHTGFTGAYVDQRLTGKMIDENTPGPRVVWDYSGRRFYKTNAQVAGIGVFELDQTAVASTETRAVTTPFKYSNEAGWVWKYGAAGAKLTIAPTPVFTEPESEIIPEPILISVVPLDQPTPDPDDAPDPEDPNRLAPPTFSIGGGTYPLAQYKLALTIGNPNSGVESKIFYRLNAGLWQEYAAGVELSITPDTEIDAFIFSMEPRQHASSTLSSSAYRSDPVTLELSLDSDSTEVSYFDLVNDEVKIRWSVTNLNAIPEYLRTSSFFTTYWTDDSSDPAFGGRMMGASYTVAYTGESMQMTPSMWEGNDTLEISTYAESLNTTWIKHSDKPSISISAKKENLPDPEIDMEELGDGTFRVTLTPSGEMPPGAQLYYNPAGEEMAFNTTNGQVGEGTLYSAPFIWEPQSDEDGEGISGSVTIDRGNGDVPITQVVLRTNNNTITQNQSVSFNPNNNHGMSNATVNNSSSAQVTLESIKLNDHGTTIVANHVNVLDVQVKNLNFPSGNYLSQITAYENGVKVGDAEQGDFAQDLERMLSSRDLRDYIRFDGNNNQLQSVPYDFDVSFSPLTNNDYLIVMERFGNSPIDLVALDGSGHVIAGSKKVVVREYSWNTGYAPSDSNNQPLFFAAVDMEKFGVDTDVTSIKGFRINNDSGADFKFFTVSANPFLDRPVNHEGELTAGAFPPVELANWFSPGVTSSEAGENGPPELEDPIEATIMFEKLTTSAGFLNEGYLVVNGVEHQFLTSDDAQGGMLNIEALVGENIINTIDIKIYTTPRLWINGQLQPTLERQMSYHSALHGLHKIQPWESFAGANASRAKLKDTSFAGFTRLEFGYEDLIHRDPYGWLDNDYNDYNFEITMPNWVKFDFGGNHFNY